MKYFAIVIFALCLIETSLGISWKINSSLWKSVGSEDRRRQQVMNRMTHEIIAQGLKDNAALKFTSLSALSKETEESETEDKITSTIDDVGYTDFLAAYAQLLHIILPVALPFVIVGLMLNTQFFHNWGYQQSHVVKSLIDQMNQVLPYVLTIAFSGPIHMVFINYFFFNTMKALKRNPTRSFLLQCSVLLAMVIGFFVSGVGSRSNTNLILPSLLLQQSDSADHQKLITMLLLLGMTCWEHPVIANHPFLYIIISTLLYSLSFAF